MRGGEREKERISTNSVSFCESQSALAVFRIPFSFVPVVFAVENGGNPANYVIDRRNLWC